MQQSATTAKLNKELAASQLKFEALKKDATGREGNLTFRYVQLPDVLNMIRPILNERGVFLSQPIVRGEDGVLRLTTRVQLEDEFLQSDGIPLPATSPGKELGKIITYARRIDLMPFLGISGEEDEDAPDLKTNQTPAWKKPIVPTQQPIKTVSSSSATAFPYGGNDPNDPLPPQMYESGVADTTASQLTDDARATATEMENFVPLSDSRHENIQNRLKDLVTNKVVTRRNLMAFLDKQHEGKKALDVPATKWEETMSKIETAVTGGEASIKALVKE